MTLFYILHPLCSLVFMRMQDTDIRIDSRFRLNKYVTYSIQFMLTYTMWLTYVMFTLKLTPLFSYNNLLLTFEQWSCG